MERGLVASAESLAVVLPERRRHGRIAEALMPGHARWAVPLDVALRGIESVKIAVLRVGIKHRRRRWRRIQRYGMCASGDQQGRCQSAGGKDIFHLEHSLVTSS